MGEIDPVALTALIISLVALLATTGQLLQQYFATADGFRRCQPSVMGTWGKRTKLKWRWREFRFETIYYCPSISVDLVREHKVEKFRKGWQAEWLDGRSRPQKDDDLELQTTYMVNGYPQKGNSSRSNEAIGLETPDQGGEMVCWVALLDRLFMAQEQMNSIYKFPKVLDALREEVQSWNNLYMMPTATCIRIHERSWDFMPPDVVRPLCLSTISDVANLVVRLGMEWKEFDPVAGNLRAEGLGHLITSRIVRSIGVVIEYRITDSTLHSARRISALLSTTYIPVIGVNDMLFGIIPGNVHFDCWDRKIGTIEEIKEFLDSMDDNDTEDFHLAELLKVAMTERPGWVPGFNDIIPLNAPRMSSKVSLLNNLPMPNIYHPGILRTTEGLQVFCSRLQRHVEMKGDDASEQLQNVMTWVNTLENYDRWNAKDNEWAGLPILGGATKIVTHDPTLEYQAMIIGYIDLAEKFLRGINTDPRQNKDGFWYNTLLDEHLRMSIKAYGAIIHHKSHSKTPRPREWLATFMNIYWDQLPNVSERVAENTGCAVDEASDAWITMIFRGFCWHHCHRLVPRKIILPSEWHASKMPVYIG